MPVCRLQCPTTGTPPVILTPAITYCYLSKNLPPTQFVHEANISCNFVAGVDFVFTLLMDFASRLAGNVGDHAESSNFFSLPIMTCLNTF